jgi:hypothetical protein
MNRKALKEKILNKLKNLTEEELLELWKCYHKTIKSRKETIIRLDSESSEEKDKKPKDPYLSPLNSNGELSVD